MFSGHGASARANAGSLTGHGYEARRGDDAHVRRYEDAIRRIPAVSYGHTRPCSQTAQRSCQGSGGNKRLNTTGGYDCRAVAESREGSQKPKTTRKSGRSRSRINTLEYIAPG